MLNDPLCNVCEVDYAEQKPDGTFYRTCSSENCIDYPQHKLMQLSFPVFGKTWSEYLLSKVKHCKLCSKPCHQDKDGNFYTFCSKICENTFDKEIVKKKRTQCKICGKPSNEKLMSHYDVCSAKCRIIAEFRCRDCDEECPYSTDGLCKFCRTNAL